MIHISIPTTQTLVEPDGIYKYNAFDIYVNGYYHSSTRYSQLLQLHQKLRAHFGNKFIAIDFPPKKFLRNLDGDSKALNERRRALEKYFINVVQLESIINCPFMAESFLKFQIDSFRPSSNIVSVDIYLADGTKEVVRCSVDHSTLNVLEIFSQNIGIGKENISKFGLFIVKRKDMNQYVLNKKGRNVPPDYMSVRLLGNHESPYISLHLMNRNNDTSGFVYCLLIKKLIWSSAVEKALMDDPGALIILSKQAASDLYYGRMGATQESSLQHDIIKELLRASSEKSCAQFLNLFYEYIGGTYEVLDDCTIDYPYLNASCKLRVGFRSIIVELISPQYESEKFGLYRATKIRTWRIVHGRDNNQDYRFEFEYFTSNNVFKWITIFTNQAIYLSLLLQSIGAEIINERKQKKSENQLATILSDHPMNNNSMLEESDDNSECKSFENSQNGKICSKISNDLPEEVTKKNYASNSDTVVKESIENLNGLERVAENSSPDNMFVTISSMIPRINNASAITDDDL